ncbi:MAG TPA: HD domain-containing phosphohydrolase [Anaeromyxobacteraceae bacterium]|nr:HD domain-containing phosphohydrolase [Anaeromyxobacteraceae bacterium]
MYDPAVEESPRVLIVDDDAVVRDAIGVVLSEEGYACHAATGAEAALEAAREAEPHLVISDVKMPDKDGIWLLDRLRREHPNTAVVMLTAYGDTEAAVECLRRGASDYLLKPPKTTELVRAIERALSRRRDELARLRYSKSLQRTVKEKTTDLRRALVEVEAAYNSTLYALVAALDAREHETGDHSQRVVRYTLALADRMGVPVAQRNDIARGALLHDIGKIGVPDAILLKPGPLSPSEWEEMRRHPQVGWNILRSIGFLHVPAEIVLSHQECWDGSGYPRGLRGEAIPLGARIFAVADTLDAMTSDRPYRKSQGFVKAIAEITRFSGTQFDPRVVQAMTAIGQAGLEAIARLESRPL